MDNERVHIHHHSLEGLKHRAHLHPMVHDRDGDNRTYYWVWANDAGRRIVWGPYSSCEEASRKGYSKLKCPFEVVPLKTRDEGAASRMLRSKLLDSSGSISESFQRFKHTGKEV